MARGMDFRKPRLAEHKAPSSLCLCQYPPEVSHSSGNRIPLSSGKGLTFNTNDVFLFFKIRWKLQPVGLSNDKKSADVFMWKDKVYKYLSSA